MRWIESYGWRRLDPIELVALTRFTTRFGELMDITGLPETYDGYLQLLVDYERERFEFDPANTRVTEATIRIGRRDRAVVPPAGLPPGLDRADGRAAARGARHAAAAARCWSPRSTSGCGCAPRRCGSSPRRARRRTSGVHPTYPHGYELDQIGPSKMLDELNETKEHSVA